MNNYICETCGVQFAETAVSPTHCPICEDERQYVSWEGQQWTMFDALRAKHANKVTSVEPNLTGIGIEPSFAIGQRALLVQTAQGNVLWDCVPLLTEAGITAVNALGGIAAIAISHPHFYSSMVEWSHAFDAPIYLHAADRQWVMRPDAAIEFWEGETYSLMDGVTLIRGGGHYDGSTMLHWAAGANGLGALMAGDTMQVAADRRFVSFMYSYPNMIPLAADKVKQIVAAVEPFKFDRVYGAWWNLVLDGGGKTAVSRSAARYIQAMQSGVET